MTLPRQLRAEMRTALTFARDKLGPNAVVSFHVTASRSDKMSKDDDGNRVREIAYEYAGTWIVGVAGVDPWDAMIEKGHGRSVREAIDSIDETGNVPLNPAQRARQRRK